jgi:hypothetical protein
MHGAQLLVVLLWFLGKESCRQIEEQELLLNSMEGGAGGCAAWWSLGASLAAKISCHSERGSYNLRTSRISIFLRIKCIKVHQIIRVCRLGPQTPKIYL